MFCSNFDVSCLQAIHLSLMFCFIFVCFVFAVILSVEVELPEHLRSVNADWRFENNWLLTATLVSPAYARPRSVSWCSEFFEHIAKFKSFMDNMPVNPSEEDDQEGAAAAEEEVRPEDSVSQLGTGSGSPATNASASSKSSPEKSPNPSQAMTDKMLSAAINKLRKAV